MDYVIHKRNLRNCDYRCGFTTVTRSVRHLCLSSGCSRWFNGDFQRCRQNFLGVTFRLPNSTCCLHYFLCHTGRCLLCAAVDYRNYYFPVYLIFHYVLLRRRFCFYTRLYWRYLWNQRVGGNPWLYFNGLGRRRFGWAFNHLDGERCNRFLF